MALLLRFPRATAFVEIKRNSLRRFGAEAFVDRVVRDLHLAPQRCVPISFAAEALARARTAGAQRVGWVIEEYSAAVRRAAEALAPQFLFCDYELLPRRGAPWPGPWEWVVYTVNDPELLPGLAARGVRLIETDAIGEMLGCIRAEGRDGR